MATDQEILKARTFRVAKSLGDSEYSAADADWYRTKMRAFLNAYRYIYGSFASVWLYPSPGQDFLEYLTPWEREWSVLARSYAGGFTPIVDENGTVIAHRGVTGTDTSTPLIAPYGDLLYTLPEVTLTQTKVDSHLKKISDWGINGKDLLQLLKDGANVFVHGRAKALPPDWRRLRYIPAETKLTLTVSVDGQLFDFVQSSTGFLKEGYSPVAVLMVGQVLATLGAKIGTRMIRALIRRAAAKGEARVLLGGPLGGSKTLPGMAVSTGGVLPVEHLGRRTIIMGEDLPKIRQALAQSHSESGFYDVVIHGDSTAFHILVKTKPNGEAIWREVSVGEVANAIRPRLAPGDKIRLLACDVGSTGGPAQQLANELNRTVWASSTTLSAVPKATFGNVKSFVPKAGGKFYEFVPQKGTATLAGGGKVTGNELQGEILPGGKK